MAQNNRYLDIVMTGYAGLSCSRQLAAQNDELLRRTLSPRFLACLSEIPDEWTDEQGRAILDAEEVQGEEGPVMLAVPVDRGGVFEALWNLAELAGCGLNVEMEKIPVRQETIEVCEVLDENPYQLPSGCHLYLTVNGNRHPGRVIGQTNPTKARTILGREGLRYLDKPRYK